MPRDVNIVSIALIGAFVKKEKFGNTEDIDMIIVLKEASVKSFKRLASNLNKICKKLSTDKRLVYLEFKEGPMKPSPGRKQKFMLHLQFHPTLEKFLIRSKHLQIDWKYNNIHIVGKKLENLIKINGFDKDYLVNGKDGLKWVKKYLIEKRTISRFYFIRKNKITNRLIKRVVKRRDDVFDIIQYGIITSLLNFIRLKNPRFKKDEAALIRHAKRNLPKDHRELVIEILKVKRDYSKTKKLEVNLKELEIKTKKIYRLFN